MVVYIIQNNKVVETNNKNIIDELYYLKATIPNENDKNIKFDIIENKKNVTKLVSEGNKIPLFDIINSNIHLINKNNVYERVIYDNYRYPIKSKLEDKYKRLKSHLSATKKTEDTLVKQRLLRKLDLMITFLNSFDLEMLYEVYLHAFYYSNPVGQNITECMRKSFMPFYKHLKPFYSKEEIIKQGYNMKLIDVNKMREIVDDKYLSLLCKKVKDNDISYQNLLDHQKHIVDNNCYGLIQYYTFHGSYFMNQYLRGLDYHNYCDEMLETNINKMYKLVRSAPKFDKDYTLYRFIRDDHMIAKLKVGDIFNAKGFISTTRDPFYNPESYKFGFIVVKIKIPKEKVGIALCVETVSLFPSEEEIIIGPQCRLRLDAKNTNVEYHTLDKYQSLINTQYEFTFLNYTNDDLFAERKKIEIMDVNFLTAEKINSNTIAEKINNFISKYVNDINQFTSTIGEKKYTIILEWYNSTAVYKDFYAAKTSNGLSFYTIENGEVLFMVELGESEKPYMYVNFYRKFSSIQKKENYIKDSDLLLFLSSMSYYFDINNVIIYSDYLLCDYDSSKQCSKGGNFCIDYYEYLKNNIKRFSNKNHQIKEISPVFSYFNLDKLKTTKPSELIKRDDRDDILYQIFKTTYLKDDSLSNFYIWIVEKYCYLMSDLIIKLKTLFVTNSLFENDYYLFNAIEYLYNKGEILSYNSSNVKIRGINKSRNREIEYARVKN